MRLKPGQRMPFKRRLLRRTNYRARLALLKSGLPRLVVRRGNDNIHAQIVRYAEDGDRTLLEEISSSLKKLGWKCHCGSIPASYLTGFLIGHKAMKAGITKAVLDIGLQASTKGNALYAVVKGAKDAGMDVPASDANLPDDARIRGEHIAAWASKLKGSQAHTRQFGKSEAESIVKNFEEVKAKIEAMFKG
ncbi:MAG: 50S ribosomal protein L18 [Candidatus Aenigmatarchaeota archaeon]